MIQQGPVEFTTGLFLYPKLIQMNTNILRPSTLNYQRFKTIGNTIGHTPIHEFPSLSPRPGVRIFGKLEWYQFGGSVKARAAYNMIRYAITTGRLISGQRLLDASSGNTGIAYASICSVLGIPLTLCLPENASSQRIQILQGLGTELILTSRLEGTDGAQRVAADMASTSPGTYYYADQYNNSRNWKAHFYGTSREVYNQTGGQITHFVAGLGTTGTFTGTSRGLKCLNPKIETISLQPDAPMHGLEGWKHLETARVPGIYDSNLADDTLQVNSGEVFDLIRFIAKHEGLILSPSAAANLLGAHIIASKNRRATIVTLLADNGDKYSEILTQII